MKCLLERARERPSYFTWNISLAQAGVFHVAYQPPRHDRYVACAPSLVEQGVAILGTNVSNGRFELLSTTSAPKGTTPKVRCP